MNLLSVYHIHAHNVSVQLIFHIRFFFLYHMTPGGLCYNSQETKCDPQKKKKKKE